MNIIDAIKSGKKFKRPKWDENAWNDNGAPYFDFAREDLLADDYILYEPKVEMTRDQLNQVLWDARSNFKDFEYFTYHWFEYVYKKLGL